MTSSFLWGKMNIEFRKSNLTIADVKIKIEILKRNGEKSWRKSCHLWEYRGFETKSRDYGKLYLKLTALASDPGTEKKELNCNYLEKCDLS